MLYSMKQSCSKSVVLHQNPFQQHPTIDSRITSQGDDEQIYCQKKDSKTDHLNLEDEYQIQPPTNQEITVELQQEDIPLDLEPILDNIDHLGQEINTLEVINPKV